MNSMSGEKLKGIPYTGTLPAVLAGTKAGYLHRYKVYGNLTQNGTPTPENPIVPSECGERTKQLFDISSITLGKWYTSSGNLQDQAYGAISAMEEINTNQLTIKWHGLKPYSFSYVWFDNNKDFISRSHYGGSSGLDDEYTDTVPANAVYYILQMSNGTIASRPITVEQITSYRTMLNSGSTALPYEPYGYKLPLLSGSTPVDIYLGESQTTRRIKKLVLTGEETWYTSSRLIGSMYAYNSQFPGIKGAQAVYCSHLPYTSVSLYQYGTITTTDTDVNLWMFTETQSPAAFKAYLAQQYANGTPVTIWYVLATEETGTLNEPLRKIGNYADTIDSTQTSAQIPTSANSTTITWAGSSLAPSQFDGVGGWGNLPVHQLKGIPYTGTLPAVLAGTKAGYLHKYKVYGNLTQNGTPTPENPIVPSECGERTSNLFNLNRLPSDTWTTDTRYYMNGGIATSKTVNPAAVTISVNNDTLSVTTNGGNGAGFLVEVKPSTRYRLAFTKSESLASDKTSCTYALVDTSEAIGQMRAIYGDADGVTFTTESLTKYIYFVFRKASETISYSNIMLSEGQTALPYEPYGYKLPLLSGSTPVDIYLGESQTTRRIKKLVLTGQEDWKRQRQEHTNCINLYIAISNAKSSGMIVSNVATYSNSAGSSNDSLVNVGRINDNGTDLLMDMDLSDFATLTEWTTYLQQQYTNGTPVTIWYVLAEPETAVVNEPLRKIGDYADTIESTQTSAQIPTTANSTTISWAGSGLAPSEFDSIQEWVDIPTYKRVNGAWVADN